jgi:VanZ family protein
MRSDLIYKPIERYPRWRWWLRVWAPVGFALCVIAAESTAIFSAQNTSGWLRPAFERLFGALDDQAWDQLHHYLRKTGHFVGYGLVCLTFIRAWLHLFAEEASEQVFSWRLKSCAAAVACTFAVASCDEIHQTMLPSRTGRFADVLLDTSGALAICLATWLICWAGRSRSVSAEHAGV